MNETLAIIPSTLGLATISNAAAAEPLELDNAFMVGVQLGELPWGGSFKPGLSVGYYFNELVYVGGPFQVGDSIERNGSSFNVENTGLDGLSRSSEEVAPRGFLGVRLRPYRYTPFASLGMVYNGADTETMVFDQRSRRIGDGSYDSSVKIRQTRPAAFRPAFGLGYSYEFNFGLQRSTAWSGWLFENPTPELEIDSSAALSASDEAALREHINDGFGSTITNKYHIFHIGAGYVFGN